MSLFANNNALGRISAASAKKQTVEISTKMNRASVVPIPRDVVDSILRLTYTSKLRLRSFRQVAQLAGVPERVVFQVVRERSMSPIGRAA